MIPTPDTDRAAAIAAMTDTSPFAEAFWRELSADPAVRRVDAIVQWAMSGGVK